MTIQHAMLVINALFALAAVVVLVCRLRTSGARIWVTVYGLGIALYGMVVFSLAFLHVIPDWIVSPLMRWVWSAVFVYLIVEIVTDRRRNGHK